MSEIVEVAFQEEAEFEVDFSGTGKDGEEGGYYIPSGTDGVMHFTPSKIGMPEIPSVPLPQGPQGEQGETGQRGADGISVTTVTRQTGDGSPGTTDEYVVKLSNGKVGGTFTVYHGKDGYVPDDWEGRLADVEDRVADLMYEPIAITSFSHNTGEKEMGATVTSVNLTWATNKTPTTLSLNGETLDVTTKSKPVSGLNITMDQSSWPTWTLRVTDEREKVVEKTPSGFTFLNGVYYGAAALPDAIDRAFVLGLTKKLSSGKVTSFNVNAKDGEYIWYCLPVRMGACTFVFGANEVTFELVDDAFEFENASGYAEPYYIYRSANAGLGDTTMGVK